MIPQLFILKLQCYFHLLGDQRDLPNCKYQERPGEVRIYKWGVHVCSCSNSRTLHWSCVIVSWDVKRYSPFSSAVGGTAVGRKHLDLRAEQSPEHKGQILCCSAAQQLSTHPALCPFCCWESSCCLTVQSLNSAFAPAENLPEGFPCGVKDHRITEWFGR